MFETESGQILLGLIVMVLGFAGALAGHMLKYSELAEACLVLIGTGSGWIGRSMGTASKTANPPQKGEPTQ